MSKQSSASKTKKTAAASAREPAETKLPGAFSLFTPSMTALRLNMGALVGLLLSPLLALVPFVFVIFMVVFAAAGANASSANVSFGIASSVLILTYIALVLFGIVVGAGIIVASLRSAQGQNTTYWRSFREGLRYFWRLLGLGVCVGLLVVFGLVLLIVPGVILLKRYFLSPYYLIDRNMGIAQAMKQSAEDTKKYGGVWGILGVVLLIALVGAIPIVGWIGSLVLSALYLCAPALRYQEYQALTAQDR